MCRLMSDPWVTGTLAFGNTQIVEDSDDEDEVGSLMEEEQQQPARVSEPAADLAESKAEGERALALPTPELGGGGYAPKPRSPPAPVEALTSAEGLPLPQGDGKVGSAGNLGPTNQ